MAFNSGPLQRAEIEGIIERLVEMCAEDGTPFEPHERGYEMRGQVNLVGRHPHKTNGRGGVNIYLNDGRRFEVRIKEVQP